MLEEHANWPCGCPRKTEAIPNRVLGTTEREADLATLLQDYDQRGGVPESTFWQAYQGLGLRKRRKRDFVAHQRVMVLGQLAHNLIRWIQRWMIQALEQTPARSSSEDPPSELASVIKTLQQQGMKRFVKPLLGVSGKVVLKRGKVSRVLLNPLYPLCSHIQTAFEALLKNYQIHVSLDKN